MGVYIKGMEMPKAGRLTLQIGADGSVYVVNRCNITAETYTTEAVPVPPHGRLIDADDIDYPLMESEADEKWMHIAIDSAPTIIPEEEGET